MKNFRLASLLMFVTLAAILSAISGRIYWRHTTISQLRDKGIVVERRSTGIALDCRGRLEEAHLERLESLGLGAIRSICIWPGAITDCAINRLASVCSVRSLFIHSSFFSDDQLVTFEKLTSLESISIEKTPITDRGVLSISKHDRLRRLAIVGVPITDDGVNALSELRNLRELNLANTRITERSLLTIVHLPRLERLDLVGTDVRPEALPMLAECDSLKFVFIYVEGDDAGLHGIDKLRQLRPDIHVHNTAYSARRAQERELRKDLSEERSDES